MHEWNPQLLAHCLDSNWIAYLTASLSVGMLIWYLMIAKRWHESLKLASVGGRSVWGWLIVIFIVCAMAGYVSLILSLFIPKTSVVFRIVFLSIQNFACPFFWIAARRYKFHLQGAYQSIGETFANRAPGFTSMSDKQIAETIRQMSAEFLERKIRYG